MTTEQDRTRTTVLVVDDERANRALLHAYLSKQHDVVEAADAASAVARVAAGGIDLVVLDVMMPGVDGFTACEEIKRLTRHEFLPVLLLSALHEPKDRVLGLKAGADDFLTKPIDRAELELRVRAFLRTRQQEQTIRRQLEALRQLDVLKDDLVSLIVHDLRNPLAGILGILQVLRGELHEATQREDVELALSSAAKLKDTLDDLLQVRQLEEGKLRLNREPVPVDALMREATETLAGVARNRSVGLVCSGEATADLDRKLMRRVLENLVMNALKYSLRGGAVEVGVERLDLDVLVEVKDRGPGISDQAKQTLFAKFGGDAGDAHRGFGLGLYLVRLAVAAHGGDVVAVDRDGGGTIIRIRLPTTPAAERSV